MSYLHAQIRSLMRCPGFVVWWHSQSRVPALRHLEYLEAEIVKAEAHGDCSRLDDLDTYVDALLELWMKWTRQ